MARLTYLADKSALVRAREDHVDRRFLELTSERRLATCGMVDLEVLFSARSGTDFALTRARRRALVRAPIDDAVFERAIDVQGQLAEIGAHRGVPIPDLVTAAAAERSGMVLLHYDADFDVIAELTGQPTEWVAPRGSIA